MNSIFLLLFSLSSSFIITFEVSVVALSISCNTSSSDKFEGNFSFSGSLNVYWIFSTIANKIPYTTNSTQRYSTCCPVYFNSIIYVH